MPSSGILKKIAVIIGLFAITGLFLQTHAQNAPQPQFLMTWSASGSYVPPGYVGKALPNQASKISASLTLIAASGQKLNLRNETIYWYLNDTLIGGGPGIQTVTFSPFGGAPNFMTLKAELPNYNGGILVHAIQIPLIQPKAVIETQHVSGQFTTSPLTLQATPYFFNITDPSALSYQWSVNGQSPAAAENPQSLRVNLDPSTPTGSTFAISLTITNSNDAMSAADSTNLTYYKSL